MLKGTELINIGVEQGEITKKLLNKRQQYVSRGISNLAPIFIASAKGAVIRVIDGNDYIDCYGGIGVLNAGHCPEDVVDAINNQAEKLIHSCFSVAMYESYVQIAEKLVQVTPGRSPKKAVLFNSGAEAVEKLPKPTPADRG